MITESQRQLRAGRIGSSDAAAICGMDPYKTPYDVWAMMTGKVTAFEGNIATEAGNYLERGIVDWIEDKEKTPVNRSIFIAHADGMRACNLDGLIQGGPLSIVEAKSCSIFFPSNARDEYGDEHDGIDGVPAHVVIQTHHQAGVVEPTYGAVQQIIVGAMIGFRGMVRYRFTPQRDIIDAIAEKTTKFFEQHIKRDIPPEGWPSADVAKMLPRVKGKRVDIDAEAVEEWRRLDKVAKDAEKLAQCAKGRVIAQLGDAEVGYCGAGIVAYGERSRSGYTVDPTTFRQLTFRAR